MFGEMEPTSDAPVLSRINPQNKFEKLQFHSEEVNEVLIEMDNVIQDFEDGFNAQRDQMVFHLKGIKENAKKVLENDYEYTNEKIHELAFLIDQVLCYGKILAEFRSTSSGFFQDLGVSDDPGVDFDGDFEFEVDDSMSQDNFEEAVEFE